MCTNPIEKIGTVSIAFFEDKVKTVYSSRPVPQPLGCWARAELEVLRARPGGGRSIIHQRVDEVLEKNVKKKKKAAYSCTMSMRP
jgi:hypothetical protein